jgi:hypothetical protein
MIRCFFPVLPIETALFSSYGADPGHYSIRTLNSFASLLNSGSLLYLSRLAQNNKVRLHVSPPVPAETDILVHQNIAKTFHVVFPLSCQQRRLQISTTRCIQYFNVSSRHLPSALIYEDRNMDPDLTWLSICPESLKHRYFQSSSKTM